MTGAATASAAADSAHSHASGNPDEARAAVELAGSPLSWGRAGRKLVRPRHGFVVAALFCVLLLVAAGAYWIASLGPAPDGKALEFSTRVLDHDGRLLRAYATPEGRWRLPARIADIDPRLFEMLFAYEDKRFRSHRGVDPLALMRAAFQFATSGRILSGGSTLTMQVARLLEPRGGRSFLAKLRQIARAVEIERVLTKDEVLSLYLDLAPYGGNIEGVRAASLAYFGKEPRRLSLGEAALLVALPQAPESRRPDRFAEAARGATNRVLDRFAALGTVPADEITLAKAEPVPTARHAMPMLAPHAANRVVADARPGREIRLTIDADLQKNLEELARERGRALALAHGPDVSLAILVVDNATGAVAARIGSPDYFDVRRAGEIDMTQALRSPGSTLKPFIYGIGFEDGSIHPETLIDDQPVRYGAYAPQNFDFTFQGTVTVRKALQLSLNVPALAVLDRVGASRLAARLAQAGASLVLPEGEAPGLAIGLGGVGIRLTDLVMLYAGIARLGTVLPVSEQIERGSSTTDKGEAKRLMEPVAAWYVANTLIGSPPPENGAPGRIAFKTGTSYGYRDALSVGFDGKHTIGVWVGRPDGAPVPGLIGRSAAAPILFDAFARMGAPPVPLPRAPDGALVTTTAKLPPPLKRFSRAGPLGEDVQAKLHILFPPDGARLELSRSEGKPDLVPLKIAGAVAPVTVLVNGTPVPLQPRGPLFFSLDGAGFARVTVIDGSGAADSVVVRAEEGGSTSLSQQPAALAACASAPCGRL